MSQQAPTVSASPTASTTPELTRREALLHRVQRVTRLPMALLALAMVALVTADLALQLPPAWERRLIIGEWLIWYVFLGDFIVCLSLAPRKLDFLRQNWLMVLSLVLPAARVFHAVAAVPALPGPGSVQVAAVAHQGLRQLRLALAGRRLVYLVLWVIGAVASGGAAQYLIEREAPGANIRSFGDALWWAAGTVTTVGTELYPVTGEGRVMGVVMMTFGVTVFGYLAGALASLFVQVDEPPAAPTPDPAAAVPAPPASDLRRLEARIEELTALLRSRAEVEPDSRHPGP
jgi:voltage-gated potassium channel